MPNRLADETSPYLLQHQNNPVDWYPWASEALARARAEDKPILLSVGYSACHWCHVMAHESFENEATAALMNEHFVCIKVDREERPDLDQIYQNVAQAMTRSGGWPLTVFLTPDLKPFFGGTYFPPDDRYGRPGFPRVLAALAGAYRRDRDAVVENAARLTEYIAQTDQAGAPGAADAGPEARPEARIDLAYAADRLIQAVDWQEGGIGGAPKFPNVMVFSFLWRFGVASDTARAREATLLTLEKLARGGIFDQLGGGFHRYSVDDHWAVPHFEKMLYDNGLLLRLYAEVLLSGEELGAPDRTELFLDALSSTVAYLLREMVSPDGLFYAAQDADSEGEEGRFFVWDPADLERLLTAGEARDFAVRYGVTAAGNFEHGKTVLHQAKPLSELEGEPAAFRARLESARAKLFAARSERIPPGTDTKALASWNGLAISGLCWAAQALREAGRASEAQAATAAARRAFTAVREKMGRADARLRSTYQYRLGEPSGEAKHNAYLDDYAFMAMAALDLARLGGDSPEEIASDLDAADAWMRIVVQHFATPDQRGYFFTSDDHEGLIHRPRSLHDQAIPAGTAVALECVAALIALDWNGAMAFYSAEVEAQGRSLAESAKRNPYASSELLSFRLMRELEPVVVSGAAAGKICQSALIFRKPPEALGTGQGDAVTLCQRQTCLAPSADVAALRAEARSRLRLRSS